MYRISSRKWISQKNPLLKWRCFETRLLAAEFFITLGKKGHQLITSNKFRFGEIFLIVLVIASAICMICLFIYCIKECCQKSKDQNLLYKPTDEGDPNSLLKSSETAAAFRKNPSVQQ